MLLLLWHYLRRTFEAFDPLLSFRFCPVGVGVAKHSSKRDGPSMYGHGGVGVSARKNGNFELHQSFIFITKEMNQTSVHITLLNVTSSYRWRNHLDYW